MTNTHEKLDALIASLNVEYQAKFIPQNESRNRNEKRNSINWLITLSKGGIKLETDYMQGIGHIPDYHNKPTFKCSGDRTIWDREREELAANKGRYYTGTSQFHHKPLPQPLLRDVLYSLIQDADVFNYESFESWADNLGYDQDSRKAEKIYHACMAIAVKLKAMLGNSLEKLQEAFQDY